MGAGIKGKKSSGSSFGGVKNTPEEFFAKLIKKAATQIQLPVTTGLIANSLGTIAAEGGFVNGPNWTSNPLHAGPWALGENFEGVSGQERLNPWLSTLAAMKYVKNHGGDGPRGFHAWWPYEKGETEGSGQQPAPKYMGLAEKIASEGNSTEGIPGESVLEEIGETAASFINAPLAAEEFLAEALSVLTDFEKLGSLVVQAFAWFLHLLAKAIWDYVIAPLVHWTERAVTWYWQNYFSTGIEEGSGFGYQIRNNAGMITIVFWSLGYAILWSDGSGSMTPVASHNSMFGQAVKGVEGLVARRSLTSPKDVKEKTPTKPKPKQSSVIIEKVDEFSVNRNRPVKVSRPAEHQTGRVQNGQSTYRVRRPEKKEQQRTTEQIRQNGDAAEITTESKQIPASKADTKDSRAGTVARIPSGARSKVNRGAGEKARSRA